MVALRELLTTDVGLMSLAVLAFIVGMGVWFGRFFRARIREEIEASTRAGGQTPPVRPAR